MALTLLQDKTTQVIWKEPTLVLLMVQDGADYCVPKADAATRKLEVIANLIAADGIDIGDAGTPADGTDVVLAASGVRTANGNGGDIDVKKYRHVIFYLDVTAAAALAADTLDVIIEAKHLGATSRYTTIATFTQVLGNGGVKGERINLTATANIDQGLLDGTIRAAWTIVDGGSASQTFTFEVRAMCKT